VSPLSSARSRLVDHDAAGLPHPAVGAGAQWIGVVVGHKDALLPFATKQGEMMRVILTMLLLAGAWATVVAQERQPRAFDAVSIKESEPTGTSGGGMRLLKGDIRVEHLPASSIVGIAHQLDSYRVVNAPDWTTATYYDILAKADAETSREDTFAMMRAMLVERFRLVAHRETQPVQGFAIVRASSNLGPGLRPSTINCEENPRGPRCAEGAITLTSLRAFGSPIANVVKIVSSVMRAPIIDKTNMTGTFDVDLRWSRDASPTDDTPVMPTALQEQLGLRLQREPVPTEVLVIDHIERPTEN
jgi:uncharacterized protein (TIGR03435 family)